jgi:hypothetical protein
LKSALAALASIAPRRAPLGVQFLRFLLSCLGTAAIGVQWMSQTRRSVKTRARPEEFQGFGRMFQRAIDSFIAPRRVHTCI